MEEKLIVIESQGKLRKVLTVKESKNGDVYFFVKTGTQVGLPPNHTLVSYEKYSIHPSDKSPTNTTVKLTRRFKNGAEQTISALTNAVKTRTGFSPVFMIRFSDLTAPVYDLKEGDEKNIALTIHDFDPQKSTFYLGMFIGRLDTPFPSFEGACVTQKCFKKVRVVLVYMYNLFPAIPFAWISTRMTFPPTGEDDTSALQKMSGEPIEQNISYFWMSYHLLFRNQLITVLDLIANDKESQEKDKKELQDFIVSLLEEIPQYASISF